jgi:hypothetical protein
MRLKTFCSLTIIPTLILILLLIASVDNYVPQTEVYGQESLGDQSGFEHQFSAQDNVLPGIDLPISKV